MLNLVLFPAEFTFSNRAYSKVTWCYQFLQTLVSNQKLKVAALFDNVDPINDSKDLQLNIICRTHRFNPKPNILQVALFQVWLVLTALTRRRVFKEASVIHHFGSFGNRTSFNIPLLLGLIDKNKFIIGPLEERVESPGDKWGWLNPFERKLVNILDKILLKKLVTVTLKKSAVIIYQSKTAKKYYESLYKNSSNFIITPGMAVDTDHILRMGVVTKPARLVTVCDMSKLKRVEMMLNIVKRLKETHDVLLIVIGTGSGYESLIQQSRDLEMVDLVTFTGTMTNSLVLKELSNCHIYLNCSLYESFGQAMLEASYCGLPIVASDTPGARMIVEDGKTGFIIPRGGDEVTTFCEKISELLLKDRLYKEMSARSSQRVLNDFSWESICEKYIKIYQNIGNGRIRNDARIN